MGRYDQDNCPICGKPLNNGEEVVVCPQCGAPYHRGCYLQSGKCIYTELHEKGEEWKPTPNEASSESTQNATKVCPSCGAKNPDMALFCSSCGMSLTGTGNQAGRPPYGQGFGNPNANGPFGQGGQPPFGQPFGGMPFGGFASPLGGVSPEEEIDGIPAEEYAAAVGRNTPYFLPRFKAISQSKAKTVNWPSLFFQGFYYIYRKMYLWGFLLIAANLLLDAPNLYLMYLSLTGVDIATSSSVAGISILSNVCGFIGLGLNVFIAFMTNKLYKLHLQKLIKKEKTSSKSKGELFERLGKKGSVNTKIILVFLFGYMILSFLGTYLVLCLGA